MPVVEPLVGDHILGVDVLPVEDNELAVALDESTALWRRMAVSWGHAAGGLDLDGVPTSAMSEW